MQQAIKAVDLELRRLVDEANISISELSRIIHVPRPSISLLINGKWDNRDIARKIKEICKEKISKQHMFQTEGQRRIFAVLDATLKDREFSLIVGPSGVGKTYTIERFLTNIDNVVLFKISRLMSTGELLRQLCEAFGIAAYGSNGMKLKRLIEKAKEIDMLVVDEADLLVEPDRPKYFGRKIEIFRELASVTAVCLVGLPILDDAIYENVQSYVYSRLGYYARVQEPTPQELIEYARQKGIKAVEKVAGAAIGRGYFRYIAKVARKASEIGEDLAIALMYHGRR